MTDNKAWYYRLFTWVLLNKKKAGAALVALALIVNTVCEAFGISVPVPLIKIYDALAPLLGVGTEDTGTGG